MNDLLRRYYVNNAGGRSKTCVRTVPELGDDIVALCRSEALAHAICFAMNTGQIVEDEPVPDKRSDDAKPND